MKFLIAFVALFTVSLAAPSGVEIVKRTMHVNPDGYNFSVESNDGRVHQENGVAKSEHGHDFLAVHGSYSWKDPYTGVYYTVKFVADEFGYHPEGQHLPKQPEWHHGVYGALKAAGRL